jgi:hypothetical protein
MKAKFSLAAGLFNVAVAALNGIMISDILGKIVFISINGTIGLLCIHVCIRRNKETPKQ